MILIIARLDVYMSRCRKSDFTHFPACMERIQIIAQYQLHLGVAPQHVYEWFSSSTP